MKRFALNFRTVLDSAASVAMITVAVVLIWSLNGTTARRPVSGPSLVRVPQALLAIDGAAISGSPNATVAMIEFSDFECPFCRQFSQSIRPALEAKYVKTGLLQIAFRQLPLVKIHANAQRAAEVAICAQQQGLFSDIHEMLFSNPNGLSEADLSGAVLKIEAAGINYQRCAASAAGQIQRDIQLAKDLGVSGTPTFFIGNVESGGVKVREVIAGARPLSDFTAAIEAARAGDRN